MRMTLGDCVASAAIEVQTSELAWIIFIIVLCVLALVGWIAFCCATRIRFISGVFYKVTFKKSSSGFGYVVSTRTPQNANKKSVLRYLLGGQLMRPFCEQSTSIVVEKKSAVFQAKKSPVDQWNCRSYPFSDSEVNQQYFNKGRLSKAAVRAIVNRDKDFILDEEMLIGVPCTENDKKMDFGSYLVERGSSKIIFFLTKAEEKELKSKKKAKQKKKKS